MYCFYRAKIFLEDGHLTIAAQTNKNLTLKTTGTQGGIYLKADTPFTEDHLPKISSALGGVSAEEALSRGNIKRSDILVFCIVINTFKSNTKPSLF